MVILDVAIVNVALPSIDDGLHFSDVGLQWVVNAYTPTFAGFLMLGGCAAELLGRRRVSHVGASTFSEGRERSRALGIWGATGALGASSGALVGGLLTQTIGWEAIFAIN